MNVKNHTHTHREETIRKIWAFVRLRRRREKMTKLRKLSFSNLGAFTRVEAFKIYIYRLSGFIILLHQKISLKVLIRF